MQFDQERRETAAVTAEQVMDIQAGAYKLQAVIEQIGTPEEANELNGDDFNGIRTTVHEVMSLLLQTEGEAEFVVNRTGYKLHTIAHLLDSVERPHELTRGVDSAWSGIRIMLEEITDFLLNIETAPQAC